MWSTSGEFIPSCNCSADTCVYTVSGIGCFCLHLLHINLIFTSLHDCRSHFSHTNKSTKSSVIAYLPLRWGTIRWKYTYIVRLCTFSSYSYIIKLLILLFSYDLWLQRRVSRWKIQCHTVILFSPSIPLILWYPINCAHPQYRRTIVTYLHIAFV